MADLLPRHGPACISQCGNDEAGQAYGSGASDDRLMLPLRQQSAGINRMHKGLPIVDVPPEVLARDHTGRDGSGHLVWVGASMDLPHNAECDVGNHVAHPLPDPTVEAYLQANARIARCVSLAVAWSLPGHNRSTICRALAIMSDVAPREMQRNICPGPRWAY